MKASAGFARWITVLVRLAAFGLFVAGAVLMVRHRVTIAIALGICAALGVAVSLVLTKKYVIDGMGQDEGDTIPVGVPDHYPRDLAPEAVALFIQGVANPAEVLSRITETVSPLTRAFKIRVAYTLEKPPSLIGNEAFFPLILSRKGRLHDDFHIRDGDGEELPTLSYSQYLEVVQAALLSLMEVAGVRSEYETRCKQDVMNLIADRAPVADTSKVREVCLNLLGLAPSAEQVDPVKTAALIFVRLVYNYAIVVPIRWDAAPCEELQVTTAVLEERYILPLYRRRFSEHPFAWLGDRAKLMLGVQPTEFGWPIGEARRCGSYHCEFMGPQGTYLCRQRLVARGDMTNIYRRMRSRLGQRYCHIYLRNSRQLRNAPELQLTFEERMPGSATSAFVSAVAAVVLIGVATVSIDTSIATAGDVVAVLLAFPGAAAAWAGLETAKALYGGSLTARCSSLVTSMLSLVAASAYLIGSGKINSSTKHLPWVFAVAHSHAFWSWSTAAAAINVAVVGAVLMHKAWLHSCVLRKPDRSVMT